MVLISSPAQKELWPVYAVIIMENLPMVSPDVSQLVRLCKRRSSADDRHARLPLATPAAAPEPSVTSEVVVAALSLQISSPGVDTDRPPDAAATRKPAPPPAEPVSLACAATARSAIAATRRPCGFAFSRDLTPPEPTLLVCLPPPDAQPLPRCCPCRDPTPPESTPPLRASTRRCAPPPNALQQASLHHHQQLAPPPACWSPSPELLAGVFPPPELRLALPP
ncbi:formin-like protein 6 [Eucalyptus grandis]|uniref:formin-like protein 6 n=1 Tax=Eucalyptus grandis TaxID=71139 RepID=UPI00192E847E|nr:formin-like protein 6 [Eucalyptus grandis]